MTCLDVGDRGENGVINKIDSLQCRLKYVQIIFIFYSYPLCQA